MSAGLLTPERRELLELIKDACPDGRAFALRFDSIRALWESCDRPDWLIWMALRAPNPVSHDTVRRFVTKWMNVREEYRSPITSVEDDDLVRSAVTMVARWEFGHVTLPELLASLDTLTPEARAAIGRTFDPSLWRNMAREFRWGVGNPFELPDPPAALMHTGPIS